MFRFELRYLNLYCLIYIAYLAHSLAHSLAHFYINLTKPIAYLAKYIVNSILLINAG